MFKKITAKSPIVDTLADLRVAAQEAQEREKSLVAAGSPAKEVKEASILAAGLKERFAKAKAAQAMAELVPVILESAAIHLAAHDGVASGHPLISWQKRFAQDFGGQFKYEDLRKRGREIIAKDIDK